MTHLQGEALQAIGDATGRSVSDLVRTAIDLVIVAAGKAGPIDPDGKDLQNEQKDGLTADDSDASVFDSD